MCVPNIVLTHSPSHTHIQIYCGNRNMKTKGARKREETTIEVVVGVIAAAAAATTAVVSD